MPGRLIFLPDEPAHSIYTPEWTAARRALDGANGHPREMRAELASLLDHVEVRWNTLRRAGFAAERILLDARGPIATHSPEQDAATFTDSDVVDVFRGVAAGCAALASGNPAWLTAEELPHEADRFVYYLGVLALASAHPLFPAALRKPVQVAAEGLPGWLDTFNALLQPVADWADSREAGEAGEET